MKLYKGFWWDYCTKNYNLEYRRVLIELLERNPEAGYLDVGCSDGVLTRECGNKIGIRTMYGMDISEDRISQAVGKHIVPIRGSADQTWNCEDNSFDVITANQLIEHLDDTDKFIKELFRVLKPGGYAIISTNNLASFHWIVMFILGIQPPTACEGDEICANTFGSPYKGDRQHRRLFMIPGLTRVLKYYGFIIEKVVGTYWFPFPIWIARILCLIDPVHSTCITVKIRKPSLIEQSIRTLVTAGAIYAVVNLINILRSEREEKITEGNNYD